MQQVADALSALWQIVPWGLLTAVVGFVLLQPEKTERIAGWLLGLFAWTSVKVRRQSITRRIQGQISDFARSVNKEAEGFMPYNIRLEFVTDLERVELKPDEDLVIVRIRDHLDDDRNLVHAMLAFCPKGVIPQARPYLPVGMSDAIDILLTGKLLNALKYYGALQYLHSEVLPQIEAGSPNVRRYCDIFSYMDQSGLFSRVLIAEIRDFGFLVQPRHPAPDHAQEIVDFVDYVYSVATRPPGQPMAQAGYLGRYIRTAFVLVGSGDAIIQRGETPIVNHIQWLRAHGYQKAYVAARGTTEFADAGRSLSLAAAKIACQEAEKSGISKRGRMMNYNAVDSSGTNRQHCLIELIMSPGA